MKMFSIFTMKKHYLYIFFLIAVSGFVYFYNFSNYENRLVFVEERGQNGVMTYKSKSHDVRVEASLDPSFEEVKLPASKAMISSKEIRTLAGTPSETEILRKWDESRGRFDGESLKEYADYNMDTLKVLADGGDLKAMIALSKLYISDEYAGEYGSSYSMPLLKKAAAYGSSYAMELYATNYDSMHYVDGSYTHDVMLEVLAWNNAAALRGDMYPNSTARLELQRKKVQLNEIDIQKIRTRSQEIYNEVLAERKALGLGDFDNSVPPEVKKFFSYFENYMDSYN
jgi:hypothetical protein